MQGLVKTFLLALTIIFVSLSITKVVGNIVSTGLLASLEQTNPKVGKEAGELVVLIGILQISLLAAVIKRKWGNTKSLVAGTLAGLLLLPTAAVFQINAAISLISQGNNYYTYSTTSPEITELHVQDTKIAVPTSLAQEIRSQYPKGELNFKDNTKSNYNVNNVKNTDKNSKHTQSNINPTLIQH